MRLSKEALSVRVVVRRARRGIAPFVWQVNRDTMIEPIYVSPESFKTMEAAYIAGKARLAEFIPQPGTMRESPLWHTDENGVIHNELEMPHDAFETAEAA